jgi:hypothetical protein
VTAARLALDLLRRADGQPEQPGPSALLPADALTWPLWLVRLRHQLAPQDRAPIHDALCRSLVHVIELAPERSAA